MQHVNNIKEIMIIEYTVEPISDVVFENISGMSEKMRIDGADITFDLDEKQKLKTIRVSFSNFPMKWEKADIIDPDYPELHSQIFKILKYTVDRIHLQVKNNSFDLIRADDYKIQVFPETKEEKENWSKFRKLVSKSIEISFSFLGTADTSDYESRYNHAQAFSNFTDALNTDSMIVKYECFYKVIETFFTTKGSELDSEVSAFMQNFDVGFSDKDFQKLRNIRNRCIHPQHNNGHIASNDLEGLCDLSIYTKELAKIAELLLNGKEINKKK